MDTQPAVPASSDQGRLQDALRGHVIVVGVCGGIAAYKVVELVRRLTQAGAEVRVLMTEAATQFVGPLTFAALSGYPVASSLFPDPPPGGILHTSLAARADLVVVAPATADMIAQYALGLARDLVSSFLLATRAPVVMAPAMHTEMWDNPATASNVATLRARRVTVVEPETGALAGADSGPGRLAELPAILAAVTGVLSRGSALAGRHVLVSAGGTQEPIDPVRFIGNRSSGRMGYAVAAEAARRGGRVTLVSGPTHLAAPAGVAVVGVATADQMHDALLAASASADVVIMAAAVADWRPAAAAPGKLKKAAGPPELTLQPTPDILAALSARRHAGQVLVGFAAETDDPEAGARAKLAAKRLDLVVGNLVGVADSGFDVATTRAVLVDRYGTVQHEGLLDKPALAGLILDAVQERFLG